MSENSSARTWVTEPDRAEIMRGKRSVMPPGLIPVPCSVTPAFLAMRVELLPLLRWRVEPAERGDDVLARLEDGGHHRRVREDRAVEDAVGVGGQQRVDVARGGDAELLAAEQHAEVDPLLGRAVDPGARQLEVGVRQDPSMAARPTPPVAHWITR